MAEKPSTISVIVPNYNDSATIGAAIESLAAQTRAPDEILVIDDGSTDDSVSVIEACAAAHPTVRFLRNDRNRGVIYTLNRGFGEAIGALVHPASADDIYRPRLLEIGERLFAKYPQAGLFCGEGGYFSPDGSRWEYPYSFTGHEGYFTAADLIAFSGRQYMPPIRISSTIFRRSLLMGVGGFRDALSWHCDYFAWEILAYRHGFVYSPEMLSDFRVEDQGYSGAGLRSWEQKRKVILAHARLLHTPEFSDIEPYLLTTGALCSDATAVLRAALTMPEVRPYLSPRLIKRGLMPLVPLTRPKRRAIMQRLRAVFRPGSHASTS